MKKKIYFIISAVLQLIASIFIIMNAEALINAQIEAIPEAYASFPAEFREELKMSLETSGVTTTVVMSLLGCIFNIVILFVAIKNTILKNKGKLIALSLGCFFTSSSSIVMILSIVNTIILLCLKRKNPEDFPTKEKLPIPKLEYQKSTKKELIFAIIFVLVYASEKLINKILDLEISLVLAIIIILAYYLITLVVGILCFKDKLKRDIKLFKENEKAYSAYLWPRIGIMYLIYFVGCFIAVLASQNVTSVNQSMLEEMPIWFTFILGVFWAPIVEELLFRGVIRRFIKNNTLFILTSGIIFGVLHTILESNITDVVFLAIPYTILGSFFAYIYAKTDNLTNNILLHAFHNAVAVLLSCVLAFII